MFGKWLSIRGMGEWGVCEDEERDWFMLWMGCMARAKQFCAGGDGLRPRRPRRYSPSELRKWLAQDRAKQPSAAKLRSKSSQSRNSA